MHPLTGIQTHYGWSADCIGGQWNMLASCLYRRGSELSEWPSSAKALVEASLIMTQPPVQLEISNNAFLRTLLTLLK